MVTEAKAEVMEDRAVETEVKVVVAKEDKEARGVASQVEVLVYQVNSVDHI
jgi:hypothetical protein